MGSEHGANGNQALPLYAHSANNRGERHLLVDHLRSVARLARSFAEPFGAGELAFLAGLWHDVGKADPEWQRRLIEAEAGQRTRIGVDHKCAGALLAAGIDQWLIGLVIHAHHGGLMRPRLDYAPWLEEKRRLPGVEQAIEALRTVMPDLLDSSAPSVPQYLQGNLLAAEMFIRMSYSALVDADSLDTEAHRLGGTAHLGADGRATLAALWERYERFVAAEPGPAESVVNHVRREVHEACIAAAAQPRGVFRLTVPTGGGKTRSAMAFALRHGIEHGLRRVIVAAPFTTITQQTASVYRNMFGDDRTVLEHHSAAAEGSGAAGDDDDNFSPDTVWQRLAAENWDAPIVVTTTVQLFESLFSNRRAKTQKLHNLAESVIILDEAQALPSGLLSPILDGLTQLTRQAPRGRSRIVPRDRGSRNCAQPPASFCGVEAGPLRVANRGAEPVERSRRMDAGRCQRPGDREHEASRAGTLGRARRPRCAPPLDPALRRASERRAC